MIKKFIEFAIKKPLLNHIFLIFLTIMSIFAYKNIPKEIFPPMNLDKISITGGYTGASADILDKMVVDSLEDDLKNISELKDITTQIKNGSFSINAEIREGSDNILVLQKVKDIISNLKKDLPADMNEPIARIKVHVFPLVLIALAGDVSKEELIKKARELKSILSNIQNLDEIQIRGESDKELHIKLDYEKIRAFNLNPLAVVDAISNISSIFPIGTIKQKANHLYISTYNGGKNEKEIKNILIDVAGKKVKISDIADVYFEFGDEEELSHYNGQRNISLNVTKTKEGNALELVKKIREVLKQEHKKHPNLTYSIYTDTSIWVKNRLNTVISNIAFGLILVFIAMLIFINKGIALVVAMGIPVSFMIGLIVTELMGDSLNMLSLLGALIALGMLVDEAIVVAENIYRHLEEGMDREDAVIMGASEMFPAVLTATLTTVFAFLPMLMMSGQMGMFIKIIPIMITVLLLSSLFEAFYFLPLHSKELLKVEKEGSFSKRFWNSMYSIYYKILNILFKKKYISLFVMISSIIVATIFMLKNSKFQLFPEFDTTQVYIYGKVDINNDLKDTEQYVTLVENEILKHINNQDISSVTSVIGFKMDAKNRPEIGENMFHIFVDLHQRAPSNFFDKYISPYLSPEYDPKVLTRRKDARDIAKDLQKILQNIKNIKDDNGEKVFKEFVVSVPGTGIVAHDIEISYTSKNDKDTLKALEITKKVLSNIKGVYNISDDADIGEKELKIKINGYGELLGFNETEIQRQLSIYYLKGEFGKVFNKDGLLRIKIDSNLKDIISSINHVELVVPNSNKKVELKEIANFIYKKGFVTIQKENGKRIRSVFASLDKKIITSSEVMQKLKPTFKQIQNNGVKVEIKGEEKENQKSKKEMTQAAIVAIFLIFITLVWLFDSIVKSLIVVSTIPLVLLGVLAGHFIMGLNLSMPGLIGIVGLAGVVVNDGLIMVDFIKNAKNSQELMQRAKTRLRPILLTSLTTVLGLFTLMFFASGQALILQPMAVALGFGIAWATVLNLWYVPLVYAIVYKVR